MEKENVRKELFELIKSVGKSSSRGWRFNLDRLLESWEKRHPKQKFKSFGFGSLVKFLVNECQATDLGSREYSLTGSNKVEIKKKTSNDSRQEALKPDKKQNEGAEANWPKKAGLSEADKEILQCNVIQIISDLTGSDIAIRDGNNCNISSKALWQCCKEKRLEGNFDSQQDFERFLCQSCFVQPQAQPIKTNNKEFSFNLNNIRDYLKSRGVGDENSMREGNLQQPASTIFAELDPESRQVPENSDSVEVVYAIPLNSTEKDIAKEEHCQQEPELACRLEEDCSVIICQESSGRENLLETDLKDPDNARMRFIQVVVCMYENGLETLRSLFKKMYPGWKNSSHDIAGLKKGNLRFDFPEEERLFNTGDIEQWDITLICKVLLFTEVASAKLKLEEFKGNKEAIKSIRELKNKLISHKANAKLTAYEYKKAMNDMELSLGTLGLSKGQFKSALEGADLSRENLFYKMYIEEVSRDLSNTIDTGNKSIAERIEKGNKSLSNELSDVRKEIKDLHDLIRGIQNKHVNQSEIPLHAAKQDRAGWDEWLRVKKELKNFDTDSCQYILIVDKVHHSDASYLTALGNIPWKLVLDLDPDSDIDGLLSSISSSNDSSGIIVSHTPSQLADRVIDFKRVQWVFANGKNKDTDEDAPKNGYVDWRRGFKTPVSRLIDSCSLKLNVMKPVFCVVLNLQDSSTKIAKDLVEDIDGRFNFNKFHLKFVSFTSELDLEEFQGSIFSNLSTKFLFIGIHAQLGETTDSYKLPSHQEDIMVPLKSAKYHFLSEYLEILHIGCENIPKELPEKEQQKFKDHHLVSFIKGNLISFESLHFGHDVDRSLTEQITGRIYKISSQNSTSQIVQISHSPGTGGSTIARRVLWKLHKQFPCAIVKMENASDNLTPESDGNQFVASLSERIGEIAEICETMPIILMDGNSRQVRNVSDHLVRKLNADGIKAILLRVVHPQGNDKNNDSYFQQKSNFAVQSILKDDEHDLNKFRQTYLYYCEHFDKMKQNPRLIDSLTRVFHFPMMAMLEEFTKLKDIVKKSLDIVKNRHPHEYEVAVLVAFLQLYANWNTPASLIVKYFEKELSINEETNRKFSDDLMCLMVSQKAYSKAKWIGSKDYTSGYEDDDDDEDDEREAIEWYTFQHPRVAQIVIEHSKRSLDDITCEFVNTILEEYNNKNQFKDLVNDLFLYNKELPIDHFSRLVMKLKTGGRIFEEAAKKTKDATFYSHAARYFAMQESPPDFKKAKQLIKEGLYVDKSASKDKQRGVRDAEGHILLREMKADVKSNQIKNVDDLGKFAAKTLQCFRNARDNPPMTYPNPLMGEVNVWQFCFDWVIKWKKADVEEAVAYIMDDTFFKTSIADCFYLLDQIDKIVQSVPWLVDPTFTMRLANDSRLSLMQVLGRTKGKTGRAANIQTLNIARLCEEISRRKFKTADEKEITRLRVSWIMNQAGQVHLVNDVDRPILLGLLERLVTHYNAYEYAENLLNVSRIQRNASYSLEKALEVTKKWQAKAPYDVFAFFYEYVIHFLCVLNGSVFQCRSPCQIALEACLKRCEGNHRKYLKRYYIAKDKDIENMCCLITQPELDKLCNESRQSSRDTHRPVGQHGEEYRKFLYECRGRIKLKNIHARGKEYPYIALEQGNIRIDVERNSLGKPHQDYAPDSRVTFAVYFSLNGPKAKGVRFESADKGPGSNKFGRQMSKNGKPEKTYCQTVRKV